MAYVHPLLKKADTCASNKQIMLALTKSYMPAVNIGTANLLVHQDSSGQLCMPLNTPARCLILAGRNWSLS